VSFTVEVQPGEELYVLKEFRGSHGHVFAMAVSNQAVYLPAQKMTLRADPWYFKRIPLSEVAEVDVVKQKSIYIYLVSLVLILSGSSMIYLMMAPVLRGESGRVSGWPLAILVAGLVIPFVARARQTLLVRMNKGRYEWKPQLAMDRKTRNTYTEIQNEILEACHKAGIRTQVSEHAAEQALGADSP